jgi:hypothetical protein
MIVGHVLAFLFCPTNERPLGVCVQLPRRWSQAFTICRIEPSTPSPSPANHIVCIGTVDVPSNLTSVALVVQCTPPVRCREMVFAEIRHFAFDFSPFARHRGLVPP